MTIGFWLAALLLCAIAAVFLVLPIQRRREAEASADRTRFNVELYEDRLSELETSRTDGEITGEEFETLKAELQKNLLTETGEEPAPTIEHQRSRLPLIVAVLVPLLAVGLYLWWGALPDVRLADDLQNIDLTQTEEVRDTIGRLAARMAEQPDNDQGWFLLANSYLTLQRYDEAAAAFEHLIDRYPRDGNLAARYAESLFLAADRTMTPAVRDAVDRTLELDPQSLPMLELLGMDAFRSGELAAAHGYFERALAAGAGGERAQLIRRAMGAVEAAMKERGQGAANTGVGAGVGGRACD
ncbi:MAG: c-type cytochrome biogenesis protein CcmI [Gammaproteobacteria bacterium]|nr:c-type cytochrome biogenesis protein CcmI [Gammaproteobacteria bacterium]